MSSDPIRPPTFDDDRDEVASTLPLERLVALLPEDGEEDLRWNARRAGERIPFCKPVAIRRVGLLDQRVDEVDVEAVFRGSGASGEPAMEGWALNVGHGGMRIITESDLEVGDTLRIEVNTADRSYIGVAQVQWIRRETDGVVAGLRFSRDRNSAEP